MLDGWSIPAPPAGDEHLDPIPVARLADLLGVRRHQPCV